LGGRGGGIYDGVVVKELVVSEEKILWEERELRGVLILFLCNPKLKLKRKLK